MYIGGWRNVLNGWDLKDDLFRDADELPPKRIRLFSRVEEGGASARFRAPSFPRRQSFGISMEIPPEIWHPAGTRRGWHFFTHGDFHLALFTFLPATWLAQDSAGNPLPSPWRELWSFGSDHIWSCRIFRAADFPGEEAFSAIIPYRPCRFSARVLPQSQYR
ncbi:MAG: hypothetical protein DRP60_09970 [Spirochaetes bacterium]|nr:MAG: hypothetical protein DRP60_09970 [Spirochaetota bacterium]